MKALTVQQPWAWAIFNGKTVENRTQLWQYRGPLAIHAGARWSERGLYSPLVLDAFAGSPLDSRDRWTTLQSDMKRRLELGAIIGTVDLVDCHPDAGCCKPWGESAYVEHGGRERRRITHLMLENPRLLTDPIPCSGALGLWTPPQDIVERLTCPHDSLSGDEGPIADLGRMPVRWKCDQCGQIIHDDAVAGIP